MAQVKMIIPKAPPNAKVYLVRGRMGWAIYEEYAASQRSGSYFYWDVAMEPGEPFNTVVVLDEEAADRTYNFACKRRSWGDLNRFPNRWKRGMLWLTSPFYPAWHIGEWQEHNVWPPHE